MTGDAKPIFSASKAVLSILVKSPKCRIFLPLPTRGVAGLGVGAAGNDPDTLPGAGSEPEKQTNISQISFRKIIKKKKKEKNWKVLEFHILCLGF